ncbi:hypothetical protein [Mesorhizobium sp.]|uniref:hypothetical protein n=1 Tax=Mesorhizobium sp. TaxID=1871066 RepID=UPI000FE80BAA|nr:hypothetical protein [Mesorhizobium sp.]RWC31560.1 MAG: hypothetical protein EOS27_10335 [Mesorhizobium sp.]TIX27834.1 MAG: hypothetical protein E5V35_04850 [Mesorhizobium sp.]
MTDQTALGQAMIRAQEAERAASQAKADALAEVAKEEAFKADIERATELSVQNNTQLLAQRMGITTNRVTTSQSVGMIAPREVIQNTHLRFNGIEISGQQGRDMVEYGQWSKAEYDKALADALALHGYKAPGSFR